MLRTRRCERLCCTPVSTKISKEYTVKLGLVKDGEYKYTVTVDKDAKIFYVNTDDEISVSSYSAIARTTTMLSTLWSRTTWSRP